MKIGIGYDIHRLVEGRPLFLGGIEIPFEKGLMGHSDGDALLHAICDAILGALGKEDIGSHFPDTDEEYKGASSKELLEKVKNIMQEEGYLISNLDSVIIAEEPKLSPYRGKIKNVIAEILEVSPDKISIKSKTSEGLGEIGEGKAISAYSSVLLVSEGGK